MRLRIFANLTLQISATQLIGVSFLESSRQILINPHDPLLLVFTPLCNPLLLRVEVICDLLLWIECSKGETMCVITYM